MSESARSQVLLWIPLIWLATGLVVTAPLWLLMGFAGLWLGGLGPLGVLAFKPGENLLGKLALTVLVASPIAAVVALVMRRWSRMSPGGRILSVIGLSAMWHAPGVVLWRVILGGLN